MAGDDAWGDTWTDRRGCLPRGLPRRTRTATCGGCRDVIRGGVRFACVACESFDLCAPCFDAGTCHAAHAFERVDEAAASLGLGSAGVPVERPEGARRGGGVLGRGSGGGRRRAAKARARRGRERELERRGRASVGGGKRRGGVEPAGDVARAQREARRGEARLANE